MKMKFWIFVIACASTTEPDDSPIRLSSALGACLLGLVEEAAALEEARALLGGDLDVPRRQQEHLVGDALHAAVERVRQAAAEVDQPLRELGVRALEVQDHRDPLLELVRDLLRVVEAARQHEMHADGARAGQRLDDRAPPLWPIDARRGARLGPQDARPRRSHVAGLGIGPVVEVTGASTRRESAHVRPLGIRALHVLVGEVALVVPVLFLGDAEVDERLVPDIAEAHAEIVTPATAGATTIDELRASESTVSD